jgi:hypothetical protein
MLPKSLPRPAQEFQQKLLLTTPIKRIDITIFQESYTFLSQKINKDHIKSTHSVSLSRDVEKFPNANQFTGFLFG